MPNSLRPRSSWRRAVSLIEVTIASAVLAVMVVPLVGLFQASHRFSLAGHRKLQAALHAQEILARTQAKVDASTYGSDRRVSAPSVSVDEPANGFRTTVYLTPVEVGLDQIDVTVRWQEGKTKKKYQLSGLVSRSGCEKKISNYLSSSSSIGKLLNRGRP